MKSRYSNRKRVECTLSIAADGLIGHGRLLDLSVPGCSVETGLHLKLGQSLRLKLLFSDGKSMSIPLGIVRWVDGWKAGIEFIRMSEEDQARLKMHVGFVDKRRIQLSAWSERVMWTGISGV